jgi:hypothetical protein
MGAFLLWFCVTLPLAFGATSALGWSQGGPRVLRGHEELTYQALAEVQDGAFEKLGMDENASTSTHAVIIGNFAMDFPDSALKLWNSSHRKKLETQYAANGMPPEAVKAMMNAVDLVPGFIDVRKVMTGYFGVAESSDWHKSPALQPMHFLRRATSSTAFESVSEACLQSRNLIAFLTIAAAKVGKADLASLRDYRNASLDFGMGMALHVIQDSFSPVHTHRSGSDGRGFADICTYGIPPRTGGTTPCRHEHGAERDDSDYVWINPKAIMPFDTKKDLRPYLRQEALWAVDASAAYIRMVKVLRLFMESRWDGFPSPPPEGAGMAAVQAYTERVMAYQDETEKQFTKNVQKSLDIFFLRKGTGTGYFVCGP